jgi:hypothetical protein
MEALFSGVVIGIIGVTIHNPGSYKYWIFVLGLNIAIHSAIRSY